MPRLRALLIQLRGAELRSIIEESSTLNLIVRIPIVVPLEGGPKEEKTHGRKEQTTGNYPHNEAFGLSCLLKVCLSRREKEKEPNRHKQGVPRREAGAPHRLVICLFILISFLIRSRM